MTLEPEFESDGVIPCRTDRMVLDIECCHRGVGNSLASRIIARIQDAVADGVRSPRRSRTARATRHASRTAACRAAGAPATPPASAPAAPRTATAEPRSRDTPADTSTPAPRHGSQTGSRRAAGPPAGHHVAQTTAARGVRGHLIENQVPRVEGLGELSRCLGQSRLPFDGVGAGERHQSSTSSPPWMSSTWLAWLATSRHSRSASTAA
jgi:hypothetical protein